MFLIRLYLFVFVNLFLYTKCSIPEEKLCVNPTCKEVEELILLMRCCRKDIQNEKPISKAQGLVKYTPNAKEVLGFRQGQEITITSKSRNVNDYWGAVINGRSGYVPSKLIKEVKVFHKIDDLIPISVEMPQQNISVEDAKLPMNSTLNQINFNKGETEKLSSPQLSESIVDTSDNVENSKAVVKPIKPSETFKIIEGTTIYSDETDEINPSAAVSVKSSQTATSVNNKLINGDSQERATVPSEIKNLNNDYENKSFQSQNNFTAENVQKNDENVNIEESKDIYAEDDEDDEEGGGDDDNADDDEDDDDDEEDEEYEIEEEVDGNLVAKYQSNKEEESRTASSKEVHQKSEQSPVPNSRSINAGSGESVSEIAVSALESSVPNVDDGEMELPPEQKSRVMLPPQNLETNRVEIPTQETHNSWSILNDFKENFSPEVRIKIPPQLPAEGFDAKYKDFQPDTADLDSKTPTPPVLCMSSQVKSIPSAESLIGASSKMVGETEPQKVQQMTGEASVLTSQGPLVSDSHISDSLTSEVIEEITTKASASSPYSSILSQFSVAADTSLENTKNTERPAVTPKIIQENVEVTTETFVMPSQQLATEPAQMRVESSQTANVVESDVETSEIIKEKVEVTTKTTITPSVLPDVVIKESFPKEIFKTAEDIKVTQQSSEDFSSSSENKLEEPNMLSQITEMISRWFSSAPKEEPLDKKEINYEAGFHDILSSQKSEAKSSGSSLEAPSGTCQNPELGFDCKDFASTEESFSSWSSWIPAGLGFQNILTQSNTFLYLVVTAVTVLSFTLGHNLIEKRGKTGPLIAKINKLEHELLVTSKECVLLKDEVQSLREKIILYENSANDELVVSLQAELEESKKARSELESSIEVLQQELDAATEAGLDLNKMLSEVLTQKGGSESILKSVESLQAQLDSQQKVIDEMTKKLGVKSQENEALQDALEAANEKSENLEEQLIDIKHNLNLHLKEKEDVTQDLNLQINLLKTRINQLEDTKEKEILKLKKELEKLQNKLSETSSALTVKEEEVKALKESVKLLKTKGDIKVETVFDVSLVKAELAKEVKENQTLTEKLQEEENSKKALAEQVETLNDEIQNLRKEYEEAKQKKDEAEKKLDVLSTYFKEKETQLQKELGLQEALWAQKKGDEKAVYNMMKSLQEEVESYKSQNETLKKEILDQERGLKNQIASLEQKAYENWVAARQAERKLEESKQEMAQLRNRLTLIEKNSNNVEGKGNLRSTEELNGIEAVSPILHDTSSPLLFPPLPLDPNNSNLLPPGFIPPPMFMPPPMGGFIPPPPFLPGDRRPPPLGRMSSPPLNNRFSPSSPADYPFERMSSPPLCLPGNNYRSPNEERELYRHRTPPYPPPLHPRNWDNSNEMPGFIPISSQRDSRRELKGSNVSSEHSSSESLDKSSRHSGRV